MKKKRTQPRSNTRHGVSREAISLCHDTICNDIEKERQKAKSWSDLQNVKTDSRWRAGTCKICGEHYDYCLTNYHASKHGFKNAEEMIQAGAVIFD